MAQGDAITPPIRTSGPDRKKSVGGRYQDTTPLRGKRSKGNAGGGRGKRRK